MALDDREERGHEQPLGQAAAQDRVRLRQHLGGPRRVERARLDEEADHRRGRGDLQAAAADVADEERETAARQRPEAEHVATARVLAGRLVQEGDLVVVRLRRARGDEPGGEGARDAALALEVDRVRDGRGGGGREGAQAVEPALGVRGVGDERAEQPRAQRERYGHLVRGRRRLVGYDLGLGHAARARDLAQPAPAVDPQHADPRRAAEPLRLLRDGELDLVEVQRARDVLRGAIERLLIA